MLDNGFVVLHAFPLCALRPTDSLHEVAAGPVTIVYFARRPMAPALQQSVLDDHALHSHTQRSDGCTLAGHARANITGRRSLTTLGHAKAIENLALATRLAPLLYGVTEA
jgi:hypothetical protein